MTFSLSDHVLWITGFGLHLLLLCILIGKRRYDRFPVFTWLIAYEVMQSLVLFCITQYGSDLAYRRGYWSLASGDYIFQVALIIEIAQSVLRPTGVWLSSARTAFLSLATGGSIIAGLLCLTVSQPVLKGMYQWEMRADVFTSVLTCELFLCMSLAANRLRLLWRSHVVDIGRGLTAWAVVACTGDVLYCITGSHRVLEVSDQIRMYVYLAAILFWAVALWFPERERIPPPENIQQNLLGLGEG